MVCKITKILNSNRYFAGCGQTLGMIIFKKEQDLRNFLSQQDSQGRVIGFVPTMGALHEGHRSLIERARTGGALTVCSIFINPTQFNDKADFERYPVKEDCDIAILTDAGCDVLFLPSVDEMYPKGTTSGVINDFGYLDTILEGAQRPGHFRGVGQIVKRLLDIVNPQYLYLGQKDYQQCMVIKKLLELDGKQEKIKVIICPTVREQDGLAMSSRNARLTEPQRALAGIIYQCLVSIQAKQESDNFRLVQKECMDLLTEKGFQPEYVALADADSLALLDDFTAGKPMVALIAARLGDTRLIDNMMLTPTAN